MPPNQRTKRLHYKRAYLVGASSERPSLAHYLDSAVSKITKPMLRAEKLGESQDNVRVVNKCYKLGTLVCGRFLDFTEGGFQPVLEIDPDAEELPIKHMAPATREQFVEGVLTFAVRGNHVVLIQAKGLRVGHLEAHLNWLLGERAGVLPPGVHISLEDEVSSTVRDELSEVDWIELRAPVPLSTFTGTERLPRGPTGRVLEELRDLRPTRGTLLERLSGDAALAVDQVELSIRIQRTGRKRDGPSLVDAIAHSLRNLDDVGVRFKTSTAIYSSEQLKLTTYRTVDTEEGSIPRLGSAAHVMQGWLAELIEQGHIPEMR